MITPNDDPLYRNVNHNNHRYDCLVYPIGKE